MPLGKTKDSATTDIMSNLGSKLSRGDAYKVAAGLYKQKGRTDSQFSAIS